MQLMIYITPYMVADARVKYMYSRPELDVFCIIFSEIRIARYQSLHITYIFHLFSYWNHDYMQLMIVVV